MMAKSLEIDQNNADEDMMMNFDEGKPTLIV